MQPRNGEIGVVLDSHVEICIVNAGAEATKSRSDPEQAAELDIEMRAVFAAAALLLPLADVLATSGPDRPRMEVQLGESQANFAYTATHDLTWVSKDVIVSLKAAELRDAIRVNLQMSREMLDGQG